MKLWTIQPLEVLDILEKTGEYTCDTKLSVNYQDFQEAYLWMVNQMDNRNIPHPEKIDLPLWAWYRFDGKNEIPPLTDVFYKNDYECVCIEFEIPDSQVLLSDFDNWHGVLNQWWLDNSKSEKEWIKMNEWFDTLSFDEQEKIMNESWEKIFDITPIKDEWCSNGQYVQATFWKLEKSMIKNVKYFEKGEKNNG